MSVNVENCLLLERQGHCHDLIKRCRPDGGCDYMCGVVREDLEDLDICPWQAYIKGVQMSLNIISVDEENQYYDQKYCWLGERCCPQHLKHWRYSPTCKMTGMKLRDMYNASCGHIPCPIQDKARSGVVV